MSVAKPVTHKQGHNNAPNSRLVALQICLKVLANGRSLSQALPEGLAAFTDSRARAFTQNLVLGCLRWHLRLLAIQAQLVQKKLKAKDQDIEQLIVLGLYQILYLDTPDHAAVSETVSLVKKLKKPWAKALVNGVLRRFIRKRESLCAAVDIKPAQRHAHPQWLFKALKKAYPEHWETIMQANNAIAPRTLRINPLQTNRDDYIASLTQPEQVDLPTALHAQAHQLCPQGVVVEHAGDISLLPGYNSGAFSVQDAAAQQAAAILKPEAHERILDACAAPGGKTSHLLELSHNQAQVLAIEKVPERLERLSENLQRLKLKAHTQVGDAANPDDWWDKQPFDKILLDAPCSATGIIRRQPDIKLHRTSADIEALVQLQSDILHALWPTLKPGGFLLYATCSVLPQENQQQIKTFITHTPDAVVIPIQLTGTHSVNDSALASFGQQYLPGGPNSSLDSDGFYYCLIQKKASE